MTICTNEFGGRLLTMAIEIPLFVSASDRQTIERLLAMVNATEPTLEQMWECMDYIWDSLGCDNRKIDNDKLRKFYNHPVWLLNGLFTEQHALSLDHREIFSNWVARKNPKRIADFGGGYGTLGRLIASKCPEAEVHVIEPHPHAAALEKSEAYNNLMYKPSLMGEYDVIVATDVFEHIPDPIAAVERTSKHLRYAGYYLIANCFWPVIKCHLPALFHFRYTWNIALARMNLRRVESVVYGSAYEKTGIVRADAARWVEAMSATAFPCIEKYKALRASLGARRRAIHARIAGRTN
jgi:hypothetical protein